MSDFFIEPGSKKGKARKGQGFQEPERLATQGWLQDINHAISAIGWSLSKFLPLDTMAKSETQDMRSHSPDKQRRPPILLLCTDQEATQLSGAAYLKYHKAVWVEHVFDPAHRSHNDVTLSLTGAGLLKFSTWCISLYNLRYGPWQKGRWSAKIRDTAEYLSKNMKPSDPLLLMFFPSILEDAGRPESDNTESERQVWLSEVLPNLNCVLTKGPKASQSRFNSLTLAHAELDKEWSAMAFITSATCIAEGWAQSAEDLWTPDSKAVIAAQVGGTASRTGAKEEAKKDMNSDRKTSANTFHRMTRFMCTPDNKNTARLMFQVLQPEALRCSRMLKELRGPEATRSYYSSWAHWSWMDTAKEHVRRLSDLEGLARIGFDMSIHKSEEAEMIWQDTLAGQMLRLLLHVLKNRAGAQLFHTNGFGSTAGLLHEDQGRRAGSEVFLKQMHQVAVKTITSGSLLAKNLLAGHCSQAPVMKYFLQRLYESDYKVPQDVQSDLMQIWSGLLNSKLIEDGNRVQRDAEQRQNASKDLGRAEGWLGLSTSELLKSYDRKEVTVDTLFHMTKDWDTPGLFCRTTVKTRASDQSETNPKPKDQLLADITGQKTWPSHNHNEEQEVLANFSILTHAVNNGEDWKKCQNSWYSGLLPEGHCVLLGQPLVPMLVVRTYRRAALCWPAHRISVPNAPDIIELQHDIRSLYWIHIDDSNVEIIEVAAVSPLRFLVVEQHFFVESFIHLKQWTVF